MLLAWLPHPTKVTALWIYPIKGCRGFRVKKMRFDRAGPVYDRRWMIIDAATHKFMSQREKRDMALIVPKLNWADGLRVTAPGMEPLLVPEVLRTSPPTANLITVSVWDDHVVAAVTNADCDEWFSKFLNHPVRLVRMLPPDQHQRALPAKHMPTGTGAEDSQASFADGFPGEFLKEFMM